MDIYREQILDLYKHPHCFGKIEHPTHSERGYNPLCGDDLTFFFIIKDGKVQDVRFEGKGCALTIASSSLLADRIKGRPVSEAMKLTKDDVVEMMQIPIGPVRMKCAILPLETIHRGVKNYA